MNYIEDQPKRLKPIQITTKEDFNWVNITLNNKKSGVLITRKTSDANVTFIDGEL